MKKVMFVFLLLVSACSYLENETDQANRLSKTYQVDIQAGEPLSMSFRS